MCISGSTGVRGSTSTLGGEYSFSSHRILCGVVVALDLALLLVWGVKAADMVTDGGYTLGRGSIPAKVGFLVGLRIYYVHTPTKITNAISKTQFSGPKKGVISPKIPRKCPFFVLGVF